MQEVIETLTKLIQKKHSAIGAWVSKNYKTCAVTYDSDEGTVIFKFGETHWYKYNLSTKAVVEFDYDGSNDDHNTEVAKLDAMLVNTDFIATLTAYKNLITDINTVITNHS